VTLEGGYSRIVSFLGFFVFSSCSQVAPADESPSKLLNRHALGQDVPL